LLTSEFCAANPVEVTDRGIACDSKPLADLRERMPLRVKFNESGISIVIPHAAPFAGYGLDSILQSLHQVIHAVTAAVTKKL